MQTLLFSRVVELRPRISFPCSVNGKELTATITHTEYTGLQMLYRVQFSDGHLDAYAPGDREVREDFGRTRTMDAYEEAVFDDLSVVQQLDKDGQNMNLRVCEDGGESFNVWLTEKNGYFSVYYKGQYQFTLRKRVRWEWGTTQKNSYAINGRLAKLLADYLDEYALKEARQLKIA